MFMKYIKFPGKTLNNMTYKSTDICEKILNYNTLCSIEFLETLTEEEMRGKLAIVEPGCVRFRS